MTHWFLDPGHFLELCFDSRSLGPSPWLLGFSPCVLFTLGGDIGDVDSFESCPPLGKTAYISVGSGSGLSCPLVVIIIPCSHFSGIFGSPSLNSGLWESMGVYSSLSDFDKTELVCLR